MAGSSDRAVNSSVDTVLGRLGTTLQVILRVSHTSCTASEAQRHTCMHTGGICSQVHWAWSVVGWLLMGVLGTAGTTQVAMHLSVCPWSSMIASSTRDSGTLTSL